MTTNLRRILLFGALAGVALWSVVLSRQETPDTVVAARPHPQKEAPARRPDATPTAVRVAQAATPIRLALKPVADLFPSQSWAPPPPPPVKAPPKPKPKPQAPALPFVYLGSWKSHGQTTYYLLEGAELIGATSGQVLDHVWRLDPSTKVGDLAFVYVPLKQTRTLRMGDPLAATPTAVDPR